MMYLFNELSQDAQTVAAERFIKDFNSFLGIEVQSVNKDLAYQFLSKSKVHRYDEKGALLGVTRGKSHVHV